MKIYRSYNFNKELKDNYYTDSEAKYSVEDLEEGNVYSLTLQKGSEIISTSCLYIKQDGVLKINKESHWEEVKDDLDFNNYVFDEFNYPKDLKCFKKVNCSAFVKNEENKLTDKYLERLEYKVF